MKIALDFDGVLSHTMKRWVAVFNSQKSQKYTNGKDISLRDIDKWAFFEKWGMPVDEAFEVFGKAWSNYRMLEPMEQDLYQKTKMLNNLAHGELDIVTTVLEEYIPNIEQWLSMQRVQYRNVVRSDKKYELDYDVFIDDSPKNVNEIFEAGKIVLMYNQPWNRHIKPSEYSSINEGELYMIYNLYHAVDVIRSLERLGRFD